MSTSKNKDSTKSSSLLSASEGVVGIFTTVREKKNAGKSGGVGVGHCNREQAVRILRRVVFGSARAIECWDSFGHGSPFYMLSKCTKVIHVSIA
jgi:hypothetical protein